MRKENHQEAENKNSQANDLIQELQKQGVLDDAAAETVFKEFEWQGKHRRDMESLIVERETKFDLNAQKIWIFYLYNFSDSSFVWNVYGMGCFILWNSRLWCSSYRI